MAAIALLLRHWRVGVAVALVAAIGVLALANGRTAEQRDAAVAALADEKVAHRGTIQNYQSAALVAAERDSATIARVARDQQAITERVTDDFQARLDDSHAAYERLRASADAFARDPGNPELSAAREAACRAYAKASCDALPGLLKAAQDNTDQLVALIAWAKAQGEVDVRALEPAK